MTQNDRLSTEIHFLHLRPLAGISLRIPWDIGGQNGILPDGTMAGDTLAAQTEQAY